MTPSVADGIDLAIVSPHGERIAASLRIQAHQLVMQGVHLRMGRDKLANMPGAFEAWLDRLGFPRESASLLIRCADLFRGGEWPDHFHPGALLLLSRAETPAAAIAEAKTLSARRRIITYAQAQALIESHRAES